ncbi:MAG: lasso peptide biosynthesis B2 protein [Candidatus Sphingomonas colombiensis]|nr:lasso peptide biosynthesis B2 protein [Sphingomonas sp.]WEK43259.1 MAG: lasso peptide biosynthesis B2 protein [Sphingomonas sp.]
MKEALHVAMSGKGASANQIALIERLVGRGVLAAAAERSDHPVSVVRDDAARPAGRVPANTIALAQFATALLGMVATMREVRRRSLRDIMADLRDAKARIAVRGACPLDDMSSIAGIAGAARGADFLFGANRWCLPRSICTMRMMMARGFAPRMVIGVVDRPFQAHCWVEIDAFIVTDAPDHVATFRPILTI